MRHLIAWMRERSRRTMARRYPVSAWVAQFDSPEALGSALDRGERPEDSTP